MKLVTHNSRFHSDDVFACATLMLRFPDAQVTRTRDPQTIEKGEVVFDVGGVYDAENLRFDHHQIGGAGVRNNKIPYASFGLVWKKFGKELSGSQAVAEGVDVKLVQPIDAMDNGMSLYTPIVEGIHPYMFQTMTFSFNPTWKETDAAIDEHFMEMVEFAKKVIVREVKHVTDLYEAESFIKDAYDRATDRRIIELDKNYPWGEFLMRMPEPLYVVRPNVQDTNWKVEAVGVKIRSFEMRKKLPASWAGKKNEELDKATGVPGCVFCHNGRFLAVAKTRDAALKLAKIAVEAK